MTISLLAAVVLTMLCLLLGYLVLGRVGKGARAVAALVRSYSLRRGSRPTSRLPGDGTSGLPPEQSRWTALDDEQFARFVRDCSH